MAEVKVVENVNCSASEVWELIRDFGAIQKWAGAGIQSCTVEGQGVGAVRTIRVPGGAEIRERLEAQDDAGRSFSYSIVGESPLPLRDYLSTLRVNEVGDGRCEIDWSSRFEPVGASEEQARGIVEGIYTGGIAGIRKTLGG
ncbi:MAG: SRPBCC family protein [Myxococcota bacterium]